MFWARSVSCPSAFDSTCRLLTSSPRISLARWCSSFSESPIAFANSGSDAVRPSSICSFCITVPICRDFRRRSRGAPVQLAQAVKNRPADAELGVRSKLYVLLGIELVESVDQPDDALVHQVLEGNVLRKVLVYAPCNIFHLRHLLEHNVLQFFFRALRLQFGLRPGRNGGGSHMWIHIPRCSTSVLDHS